MVVYHVKLHAMDAYSARATRLLLVMLRGRDRCGGVSERILLRPPTPSSSPETPSTGSSQRGQPFLQRHVGNAASPSILGGVDADRAVTVATELEKPTILNCGGLLVRDSGHVERVHDPVALTLLFYCFLPLIASLLLQMPGGIIAA